MDDFKLSEHFSFFELTRTDHAEFQENNRIEGLKILPTLMAMARLLEQVRGIGPLVIHSGFRHKALNTAVGSSDRSQHLRGEAADFSHPGAKSTGAIDELFRHVLETLIGKMVSFGQLIKETQERSYGVSCWVHLSLGTPFRSVDRCGEVLEMLNGKYTLLRKVKSAR